MNKVVPKKSKAVLMVKALIASYIVTALILLLIAFFMYKLDVSKVIVSVGVIISYLLSCFLGGLILGKCTEQKRFLWGIAFGVLYFVIIIIVSIVLNKGAFEQLGNAVTAFILCTLGGMLGGMVS